MVGGMISLADALVPFEESCIKDPYFPVCLDTYNDSVISTDNCTCDNLTITQLPDNSILHTTTYGHVTAQQPDYPGRYLTYNSFAGRITTGYVSAGEGLDSNLIQGGSVQVTLSGEDASDTNKGIAKFPGPDFSVSSGSVSINDSNINISDWADQINGYPAACSAGQYVTQIGDTLTCSAPSFIDTNASTACSGHEVFLDGEGVCDDTSDYLNVSAAETITGSWTKTGGSFLLYGVGLTFRSTSSGFNNGQLFPYGNNIYLDTWWGDTVFRNGLAAASVMTAKNDGSLQIGDGTSQSRVTMTDNSGSEWCLKVWNNGVVNATSGAC